MQLFHGLLKSEVRCRACGACSRKFEPFSYLSLPVNQPNIIVQFKYYAQPAESLDVVEATDDDGLVVSEKPKRQRRGSTAPATTTVAVEMVGAPIISPTTSGTATPDLSPTSHTNEGRKWPRYPRPRLLTVELTSESLIGEFVKKCEVRDRFQLSCCCIVSIVVCLQETVREASH